MKTKICIAFGIVFLIIGAALAVAGLGMAGFNYRKLGVSNSETLTNIVDAKPKLLIEANALLITVIPTTESQIKVEYEVVDDHQYSFKETEDTYEIYSNHIWKRTWYLYTFGLVHHRKMNLYVPNTVKEIDIHMNVGEAIINDLSLQSLQLNVTTGRIRVANTTIDTDTTMTVVTGSMYVQNVTTTGLYLNMTSGSIIGRDLNVNKELNAINTTGEIKLERFQANSCYAKTNTGKAKLKSGTIEAGLYVGGNTGEIQVENCHAKSIELKMNTGSIRASLTQPKSQYHITVHKNTGSSNISSNDREEAPYQLIVSINTGSIKVNFS